MKLPQSYWSRRLLRARPASHEVLFTCNVCGASTACARSQLQREAASCHLCGSTVRMRSIVHLVSVALFGRSVPLPEFPRDASLRGIGLSDWPGYARRLTRRVNYTNTYYHRKPFLDITDVLPSLRGTCDFVISSDVFEHVVPPVSRAFEGALQLLKPGGTLVLTVPFAIEFTHTREHFPQLHDFEIRPRATGERYLVNTRADGTSEEFSDLVFHGGPGDTLEMREFSRASLQAELQAAGFHDIRFCGEAVPEFGIAWDHPWSIPVVARRP